MNSRPRLPREMAWMRSANAWFDRVAEEITSPAAQSWLIDLVGRQQDDPAEWLPRVTGVRFCGSVVQLSRLPEPSPWHHSWSYACSAAGSTCVTPFPAAGSPTTMALNTSARDAPAFLATPT